MVRLRLTQGSVCTGVTKTWTWTQHSVPLVFLWSVTLWGCYRDWDQVCRKGGPHACKLFLAHLPLLFRQKKKKNIKHGSPTRDVATMKCK